MLNLWTTVAVEIVAYIGLKNGSDTDTWTQTGVTFQGRIPKKRIETRFILIQTYW